MRPVPRVTLVVPCYNEEHRLNRAAFESFREADFCFVNDGSRDGTLQMLQAIAAVDPKRLTVVNLEQNSGKAEAVRRGFEQVLARADAPTYVGFWDADLATPLGELPRFLEVLDARDEIQMVMGARVRLLGREISRQASRHYFGRTGATLISASLGLAVYDTQCGAKVFRSSDLLRRVFSRPFLSRWIFDVEIIARLIAEIGRDAASRAIYELPLVQWHDVKGSKVKTRDYLRGLADLWKIHRAYNARR
jgi:glycosyltransferase involved in cell wall biosynthesis